MVGWVGVEGECDEGLVRLLPWVVPGVCGEHSHYGCPEVQALDGTEWREGGYHLALERGDHLYMGLVPVLGEGR